MKKFLFLTVLSVFFAALVFTQPASATMTLSVSDGTNTVSIVDNGAGDFSPTTGVMGYSGTLGSNWFLTGAQSFQGADSYMHLSDMSITSTTGGTLHITLTDTFVYNANTIPMASIMAVGGNLATVGSITVMGNISGLSLGSLAFRYPPSGFSGQVVTPLQGLLVEGQVYTVTLEAYLTHTGAGTSSFDLSATLTPVPEPATMLLLGSGLVGVAAFRKRFKKN